MNRRLRGRIQFAPGDEPALPAEDDLVALAPQSARPDRAAGCLVGDPMPISRWLGPVGSTMSSSCTSRTRSIEVWRPRRTTNSLAWSLGVTVPLPIYNRQQGNIEKAHVIASQARTQLEILEKLVEADVRRAYRQHQVSENAVVKAEDEMLDNPPLTAIKHLKDRYYGKDEDLSDLLSGLEKMMKDRDDDKLKEFDAKDIQHRRSMLKLNTAVGCRIFP